MRCVTEWRDTDRERAPGWGDGEAGSWIVDEDVDRCTRDAAKEHDPMAMLEGTSSKSKRSSLLSFDLRVFIRSPKHLTEHHSRARLCPRATFNRVVPRVSICSTTTGREPLLPLPQGPDRLKPVAIVGGNYVAGEGICVGRCTPECGFKPVALPPRWHP